MPHDNSASDVHASLRALLDGMDGKRRARLELRDRIADKYLSTKRDETLFDGICNLIDDTISSIETDHPEGGLLAVVGEPGAGKTWAIEHALERIPGLLGGPLLFFVAPAPCTLKQLGRKILSSLGYELKRDQKEHLTWELVRTQLKAAGKHFVWIDEMHHALSNPREGELTKISETLKNVMQQREWPVGLILSGRATLSEFIGLDRQIERRSATIEFGQLSFPEHTELIRHLVITVIDKHAGMRVDGLLSDEFVNQLCHAAEGSFGTIIVTASTALALGHSRSGAASESIKSGAPAINSADLPLSNCARRASRHASCVTI